MNEEWKSFYDDFAYRLIQLNESYLLDIRPDQIKNENLDNLKVPNIN